MKGLNRREFLTRSVRGTVGLIAVSALPLGLTACNQRDPEAIDVSTLVDLGPVEDLIQGELPKKVSYKATIKDAWVEQEMEGFVYINIQPEDGTLLVMSPTCTHLGCTAGDASADMQQQGTRFHCPCHGGEFDEFGINIAGPPPRPLDTLNAYEQDGHIYISVLGAVEREK